MLANIPTIQYIWTYLINLSGLVFTKLFLWLWQIISSRSDYSL